MSTDSSPRSPAGAFPLEEHYVLVTPDGAMTPRPKRGTPPRIDGLTIGFHRVTASPPHDGELHPSADELLVVITGSLTAVLHCDRPTDQQQLVHVSAGDAVIVRARVWHRLIVHEPTTLLHATPGPDFDVRPLPNRLTVA